mgnify:CR=1 FL=1
MSKLGYILIGDPHVVVDELAECERLMDFVRQKLQTLADPTRQSLRVVFLGDLYNNHAHVRVEVMDFWTRTFNRLKDVPGNDIPAVQVYALVGNHDRPHVGDTGHALQAHHQRNLRVIGTGSDCDQLTDAVAFVGYHPTNEGFLKEVHDQAAAGAKLIFGHQTINGAKYENGFFAPDGVPVEQLPEGVKLISGHIHTPQTVGPCWYVGAPRWRSISDANVDRHIHFIEVDGETGEYEVVRSWSTDEVCTPIRLKTITTMEEAKELQKAPGLRVTVEGDESYVKKASEILRSKGIRFRGVITHGHMVPGQIRESEGVPQAFQRFFQTFDPPGKTPKDVLQKMVAERVVL